MNHITNERGKTMKEWIEKAKPYFPVNKSIKKGEASTLAVAAVIYLVVIIVVGFVVGGILGGIPLIGLVFQLVSTLISLYALAGLLLALYEYYK